MKKIDNNTYKLSNPEDVEGLDHKIDLQGEQFYHSFLRIRIKWFCQLRWASVLILLLYGLMNFTPGLLNNLSLKKPGIWPFIIVLVLSVSNLIYLYLSKISLLSRNKRFFEKLNLWSQIIIDILILSVVIYKVGILNTYIGLFYLFHISLACIFFSRKLSFFITIFALVLYIFLFFHEVSNVFNSQSILLNTPVKGSISNIPQVYFLNLLLTIFIFIILWYLSSLLSNLLRMRNKELSILNDRLQATQKTKDEYMLRTTHELKAPFAAIGSNVQLLKKGYCGKLPKKAVDVLDRIERRCKRLSHEILEMLQLSNLKVKNNIHFEWEELDIAKELLLCIEKMKNLAKSKSITIKTDLNEMRCMVIREQIRIMFTNLLSNAINYSKPKNKIFVCCKFDSSLKPVVIFTDHGIGISPEKIPKIFDEYYRTDEAVEYNFSSSGLGLAIVSKIAQTHSIDIEVNSIKNKGTKFTLIFGNNQKT